MYKNWAHASLRQTGREMIRLIPSSIALHRGYSEWHFSSLSSNGPVTALATTRRYLFQGTPVRSAPSDVPVALAKDLKLIIEHDRIVAFLTGTPTAPRCRFTVQLVDILEQLHIQYGYFNILDDDEVCEGLKKYTDWPTYPQLFIDGELIGGFDVVQEMMLNGSFPKMLKEKKLLE